MKIRRLIWNACQHIYPRHAVTWVGLLFGFYFALQILHATENPSNTDLDGDGLSDAHEQELAETFAPIVFHENIEPNLPTNVYEFLKHTVLRYHDENCSPPLDEKIAEVKSQDDLLSHIHPPTCGSSGMTLSSSGTLSDDKRTSFYLTDVDPEHRRGSSDSSEWATYFHCYPTEDNGIVLQYWRFYAYNTGKTINDVATEHIPGLWLSLPEKVRMALGWPMAGFHGGDWEAVQIILDKNEAPRSVWMLGHTAIDRFEWEKVPKENTHIRVKAEYGGHSSLPFAMPDDPKYIRQECWTHGQVQGNKPGFKLSVTGPLINIGEKLRPLNGGDFVRYSGLWGSPSQAVKFVQIPLLPHDIQAKIDQLPAALYPYSSGYWGPAYNETEKRVKDDFITAWGHDMKTVSPDAGGQNECYPKARLPLH